MLGILDKNDQCMQGNWTFRKNLDIDARTGSLTISQNSSGHPISITGTWGTGILGASINIGDYSNAIAFGEVSEHIIGIVNHVSASFDDASNAIPILGKFTTTADSDSLPIAQCIMGQGVVAHNFGDVYGVRGSVGIAGTPVVNQIYGVNSTITLSTTASIAATGAIALYGGVITGAVDLTAVSGSPPVAGMYLSWQATAITTLNTHGILINVGLAAANLDYGVLVKNNQTTATVGTSFASIKAASGTITTAYTIEGAHTNAFAVPVAGTAPTVAAATGAGVAAEGSIKITVGGVAKYLQYFAATS